MHGMDSDVRQIHVRLEQSLLTSIDERRARFKLSRNEWITKALQRAVDMPTQVATRQERF